MATEILSSDPAHYGAAPLKGNFTGEASMHLWCAKALSAIVANDEATFGDSNDDIQSALRYLLSCEVRRAQAALGAEAGESQGEQLPPVAYDQVHEAYLLLDSCFPTIDTTLEVLGDTDSARTFYLAESALRQAHAILAKLVGSN